MTIIDDYIVKNSPHMTVAEMSENLGLDAGSLLKRMKKLGVRRYYQARSADRIDFNVYDEMRALISFIEERKFGLCVDIAKSRLLFLGR